MKDQFKTLLFIFFYIFINLPYPIQRLIILKSDQPQDIKIETFAIYYKKQYRIETKDINLQIGPMNKSSLDKLINGEGFHAADLVSVDFKGQSLHKFLQNVVMLVNQHNQRLNHLESQKISTQKVRLGIARFIQANKLSQPVLNTLPSLSQKIKVDTFEETVQGLSINMKLQAHSIQYIYDNLKKKQQQLFQVKKFICNFHKIQENAESIKKAVEGSKRYTDEQVDKVLKRLKQLESKTNKKISQFQNTTKQIEKKTLWKINECESALIKKVTADYVQKALEQSQLKINNDIKNNKNQDMNQLKFCFQNIKGKLESLTKNVQNYDKQNMKKINQLSSATKGFQTKQKTQQIQREMDQRLKQMLIKIDRLQKRQDPRQIQMKLEKTTFSQQQKLECFSQKVEKIQNNLQIINNLISSLGSTKNGGFDAHKICNLEGQVRRLKDSSKTSQSKLQGLEQEVKTKLIIFQQRVMTTLSMLRSQDSFVSKDQMYQLINRFKQPVTQRLNQNQSLIQEISAKLTKLELFQRATKKKVKQLTKGDQLNKTLDMKLGVQEARSQFNAINLKLQALQFAQNKLKSDIQAHLQFIEYLKNYINEPEEGINILGPKKKVFPVKCLGCGYKHNPIHQNNMMVGTDGKLYKVDLRNNYTNESKQVYGVTSSQIGFIDSTATIKKSRVVPVNRPSSSKSNVRNSSAYKCA